MKNLKTILVTALIFASSFVNATDLVVREGGAGGAYSTISDALAVAVNGDRIIIQPKSGGAFYVESFSVTKNLQFLCENEGEKFAVQGNITITPSTPLEIIFIGLDLDGDFSATGNAPATARTIVKLLYSDIAGHVNFNYNNYDLTVANGDITGRITFRAGRLIGNNIYNSSSTEISVYINDETTSLATHVSDTIQIIGNKIYNYGSGNPYSAIYCYSNDYYYQINNNYIRYRYKGIHMYYWKNSTTGNNEIINNTFYQILSPTSSNYAILCSDIPAGAVLKIYNNLFEGKLSSGYDCGILGSTMENGLVNVGYNMFDNGFDEGRYIDGVNDDGTNITSADFVFDTDTGEPTSGDYLNAGHPDSIYYDLNLTRNDIGCYGASNSHTNYFITGDLNNNRVFLLNIPKRVITGNPIRVEAEGFDK